MAGSISSIQDAVADANSVDLDELRGHDAVNRLNSYKLSELNGTLDGITGTPAAEEGFTYDQTHNWANYLVKAAGTTTLDQQRTHDAENRIGTISATTGTNWAEPVHNAAGHLTSIPKPSDPANSYTLVVNAWGQVTEVIDATSSDTIEKFRYDPLFRRNEIHVYSGGSLDHVQHLYYGHKEIA